MLPLGQTFAQSFVPAKEKKSLAEPIIIVIQQEKLTFQFDWLHLLHNFGL